MNPHTTSTATSITVAHSPDSDDAFMFYGLASGSLETDGIEVKQIHKDIQTLNIEAREELYDVSAISFGVYPEICKSYALLSSGASIGYKYGPILIAKQNISLEQIPKLTIAIPGRQTTACLVLNLYCPGLNLVMLPFNQIMDAVQAGEVDAGLLIHEGQLTYIDHGFNKILDLGLWWFEETGLPLPLGGNAIRKALGAPMMQKVSKLMQDSIIYSLDHRAQALEYAMTFAPGLSSKLTDEYIGMYVNDFTVDLGDQGRRALERLYGMAFEKGLIPKPVELEIV
jgi:1,4-dihydroxy-6-naphthoate synthase